MAINRLEQAAVNSHGNLKQVVADVHHKLVIYRDGGDFVLFYCSINVRSFISLDNRMR